MNRFTVNVLAGLNSSFWWCFFTGFACSIFLCPDYSIGSNFTVHDIINGIEARRSKISDVELQYLVTQQNHDAFYSERLKSFRQLKEYSDPNIDLDEIESTAPPRSSSNAYNLFLKANKAAFEIFSVNEGVRALDVKAVYDGENLKLLNVREKNGVVTRVPRSDVLHFPTLPNILSLENQDIADYLQNPGIDAYIIRDEEIENEGFIVELAVRRTYTPHPKLALEMITEYLVRINVQKDFWPVKIEKYLEEVDTSTGEKARYLQESITASDFVETDGIYFPTKIIESKFYNHYKTIEGSLIPQLLGSSELLTERMVVVENVAANTDFPDDVFDFEFPDGTDYYDANAGIGMVVGQPTEFLAECMRETFQNWEVELAQEGPVATLPKSEQRKPNKMLEREEIKKTETENSTSTSISSTPLVAHQEHPSRLLRSILYLVLAFLFAWVGYLMTKTLKKKRTTGND